MITFIVFLIALAALIGLGLAATKYGVDSRHADPRDMRHNWG